MAHRLTATVILMVAMLMDLMDSTITNVALPAISADLGATPSELEWTLAGYVVAFATFLLTGGRLGDIYGRKRIFTIGVIGFTCASALVSLAWSGDVLIAARVIQGAFAGVMVPQVLSSVQVMYAPEERGPVFGIVGALSAIGAILGLILGGWLVTANVFGTGWRSVFLINVPVGIALTVAALLFMPESRSEKPMRPDLAGVALGALAVVLVVLPLTEGRAVGWAWWIWVMLLVSPVAVAIFIWQQRRRSAGTGGQLLPLPLFKIHSFSSGLLVQVISSIGHGGFALVLLYHMQSAFQFTSLAAGFTLLPIAVGSMLGTPVAMFLMSKFGKWTVLIGGLLQAASYLWVMFVIEGAGTVLSGWSLLPPLGLAGIGMMVMIMPLTSIALAEIPPTEAGAASGTLTTFGQVGTVLGIALAGTAYFGVTGEAGNQNVNAGLWVVITAYALAGVIAPIVMPKPSVYQQKQEVPSVSD